MVETRPGFTACTPCFLHCYALVIDAGAVIVNIPWINPWLNAVLILRYTQQVLCYYVYDCIHCHNNCKKTLIFNPWLNRGYVLRYIHHILYYCWRLLVGCKYLNIQPRIELYPRFIVPAKCLDVIADDSASIVNITAFNLGLNYIYVLQCVQRVLCYYTPIANSDLRITSITKFNLWLNYIPVLWRFHRFMTLI